ncbi:MAG: hypothetical protein M3R08_11170 [Bacteroidota bacterium]|nr:hypothetical protein [Bacteroidota bacterium]
MFLSIAPYRLLFKGSFGTAHGARDGTDSVFVRLERNGRTGFGEATMPPYLQETQSSVIDALRHVDLQKLENHGLKDLDDLPPCARAALSTAYYDLISKEKGRSIESLLELPVIDHREPISLITLGLTECDKIPEKLDQLPPFNGLKVKLDGNADLERLEMIMRSDQRLLLIDANQAWTKLEQALDVIDLIGSERLIGLEQPFPLERLELQEELIRQTNIPIYADESIKNLQDLDRLAGSFSGVNLKLMKCGGLDIAGAMAKRAHELGLNVMLGSMSESSLGCGAMFQLAPIADVLDLDGPWLIGNDPFEGLILEGGELRMRDRSKAFDQRDDSTLSWRPVGA